MGDLFLCYPCFIGVWKFSILYMVHVCPLFVKKNGYTMMSKSGLEELYEAVYTLYTMAGHNKWSKIKHKKAGTDAQKSKVFGRLVKLLTVESRQCGGDRSSPALKSAIEQAKAANMPSQNIDRAIVRGVGGGAESLEAITYEMYGPGGCAILINTLTDNKNRTAAEIRHIITKNGYAVGAPGSAAWVFVKQEGRVVPSTTVTLSEEDGVKLDALVVELDEQEDTQEILTNKA